jgi:hypothetical protein
MGRNAAGDGYPVGLTNLWVDIFSLTPGKYACYKPPMKVVRPRRTVLFLAALLIFHPLLTRVPARAGEQSPPFNAPWTQEKVTPPEVEDKDKKNEKPVAWCTKGKWKKGARVVDAGGDPVSETDVTYGDGTKVHYEYSKNGPVKWVVTLPGGKKITYDPTTQKKTTEEPGKPPKVDDWKEAKDAAAKPSGKPGSWLYPSDSRLTRVAFQTYDPIARASREIQAAPPPPSIFLAATSDQPRPPDSQSQGKVVIINLKIVTYGDPPSETVAFFDPGPQMTPEEFLDTPVTTANWDPKRDADGPRTTRPGPTGIPITEIIPGSGIYIGWGWTSGYVGQSMVEECGGGGDDSDLQEAKRLAELAKKAIEGGPEYWRKKALTEDANARRAQQDPGRERAATAAQERAKQDRATADELEKRGVPDKPDPQLPKNQRDDIDKQRADAIKKITDEAGELNRKASTK